MNGRGGDAPHGDGGEFLLQLLRRTPNPHPNTPPTHQQPSQMLSQDPAVAAVGPSIPNFHPPQAAASRPNNRDFPNGSWNHSTSPPFAPYNHFPQNPSGNPNLNPGGFNYSPHQFNLHSNRTSPIDETRKFESYGENPMPQRSQNLIFGSLNRDVLRRDAGDVLRQSLLQHNKLGNLYPEDRSGMERRLMNFPMNSLEGNDNARGNSSALVGYEQKKSTANSNNRINQGDHGSRRAVAPPPGFSSILKNREPDYLRKGSDHNAGKAKGSCGDVYKNDSLSYQFEYPGPPAGSSSQPLSTFDVEEPMRYRDQDKKGRDHGESGMGGLNHLMGSLPLDNETGQKSHLLPEDESDIKKHHRDKEYRSDKRGQWIMTQRIRNLKSRTACHSDINRLNDLFLSVFESLIPANEEKVKQKQLLTLLEKLVSKEWPEAQLYLYGSCANSFGFSKSDIDVCLSMDLGNNDKSEVVLKLAEILQSENLHNVQALTHARVPVVKLMDPVTGISCDICVNNMLAVVNTKLLHDYARIDVRLRQLAFIVKHWAKSRGVNETYRGTLSSYAYVLMCINFLQKRSPPILPCLQGMDTTYIVTVDNVECAYFDKVEKLQNYGSQNRESIAKLVWAFFHYWAYCHDYANDVISVRTGSTLSKRDKDWTRRVGNDRHLICIEDPFELSHDLGRVVDKFSIRVIREEFERAAEIMHQHPNPCSILFEPYVPD